MAAVIDIANLALSHLGTSKTISKLDELSDEARAVSAFYDLANQQAQRDFPWNFGVTFVTLALVADNPTTEWLYSYQYPNLCMNLRRILGSNTSLGHDRYPVTSRKIPYRVVTSGATKLIYTQAPQAVAEISTYIQDPNLYPADYVMALSFLLAFYIAPRVTAGDPFKLGDRAYRGYQMTLASARTASANEDVPMPRPQADLIRVRR